MPVNENAKSNINPITLAFGENEAEYIVAATNSGYTDIFEPLTGVSIDPGQTVSVLIQGDYFNESVQKNFNQLIALVGDENLEFISGPSASDEWPIIVGASGCTLGDPDPEGYRTAEWNEEYENFSPLNPSVMKPGFFVFSETLAFSDDYVISIKMPAVSGDDVIMIGLSDYPVGNFDNENLVAFAVLPGGNGTLMSNAVGSSDVVLGVVPVGEDIYIRCTSGALTATSETIGTDIEAPESSIINNGNPKSIFVMSFSETIPNPITFKISAPA